MLLHLLSINKSVKISQIQQGTLNITNYKSQAISSWIVSTLKKRTGKLVSILNQSISIWLIKAFYQLSVVDD